MGVKRHVLLAAAGTVILVMGVVTGALWLLEGNRQVVSAPLESILVSNTWRLLGGWFSLTVALLGLGTAVLAIGDLNRSLLSNWLPQPREAVQLIHQRLSLAKGPRIVALGGGTGLSNLLRGLRNHTSNITAVVTVSDDGGSSGRLRAAFGMPAPGDIVDCLAALSDNELAVSRLLEYRFQRGAELQGHTFGNLLITTLTEVEGDFAKAVRLLNSVLNLVGSVYPVSDQALVLEAVKRSGEVIRGESRIRESSGAIREVRLEPDQPRPLGEVVEGILAANLVVLGPGSLFTSTIPPLLVPAIRRSLLSSAARVVYVCNIMTEAGETDDFSAFDHVEALRRHLGKYPNMVVINTGKVDPVRLQAYQQEGAEVVVLDEERFAKAGIEVIKFDLLGSGPHAQHDSERLASWLIALARKAEQTLAVGMG